MTTGAQDTGGLSQYRRLARSDSGPGRVGLVQGVQTLSHWFLHAVEQIRNPRKQDVHEGAANRWPPEMHTLTCKAQEGETKGQGHKPVGLASGVQQSRLGLLSRRFAAFAADLSANSTQARRQPTTLAIKA